MLDLDPNKRITADEAIKHPYFKVDPIPASPEQIELFINSYN